MNTNLQEVGELARQIFWARVLQTEGTARAKVLRLECARRLREEQGCQVAGVEGTQGQSHEGKSAGNRGHLPSHLTLQPLRVLLGSPKPCCFSPPTFALAGPSTHAYSPALPSSSCLSFKSQLKCHFPKEVPLNHVLQHPKFPLYDSSPLSYCLSPISPIRLYMS